MASDKMVNLFGNIVQYIEGTQDVLQKQANLIKNMESEKQQYAEKVASVVEYLEREGYIPSYFSDAVKQDFIQHPVKLAEFISEINSPRQTLGEPGEQTSFHAMDAIERFAFGE